MGRIDVKLTRGQNHQKTVLDTQITVPYCQKYTPTDSEKNVLLMFFYS